MQAEIDNKQLKNILQALEDVKVVLTEQELLNLLKIRKRWPKFYPVSNTPSIEVINITGLKSSAFFSEDGYLDYNKWFECYQLGYTTIISNVLDLTEDLRNFSKVLMKEIGFIPHSNFYFSRPGKRASFPSHSHPYDVFVKQIYGTSDWIINGEKIRLFSQKTLVSPKNMLHEVVTKKNKKLSLTMNIDSFGQY